ncbi:MAG: DUF1211 domain-containing protein [Cyclobacteriaceae bacterium]
MRQVLKDQQVGLDSNFRYRGLSQTRVETFSDAAFALAITLLVLSSTVPQTFDQLRESMRMIPPFAFCVALIALIWYQHYIFFLKYGLQNIKVVIINTILIFLILVYVYPLKFLSRFVFEFYGMLITGNSNTFSTTFGLESTSDVAFLLAVYGFGAAMIFMCLAWLYRYALGRKEDLDLNEYEEFMTRASMRTNLLLASIPLTSACVAALDLWGNDITLIVAGNIYFFYPIVMIIYGRRIGELRKKKFDT